MKIINILFLFLILLTSCDENKEDELPDCSAVSCLAFEIKIELIDADTDLNYIDSNQLSLTDIVLSEEDLNIDYWEIINNNNEESIIVLGFIEAFSITVPNEESIAVILTEKPSEANDCCGFVGVEKAETIKQESFYDEFSNTLTIKI